MHTNTFYTLPWYNCQSQGSYTIDNRQCLDSFLYKFCFCRTYYSQNVFGDRDTLQPHKGEMIAAYFAPEECWYRALVLNSTENEVKVHGCINFVLYV